MERIEIIALLEGIRVASAGGYSLIEEVPSYQELKLLAEDTGDTSLALDVAEFELAVAGIVDPLVRSCVLERAEGASLEELEACYLDPPALLSRGIDEMAKEG